MPYRFTRRDLLKRTAIFAGAAAGARLIGAPYLLADRSPNSKLATVVIGCGGRSQAHLPPAARERLIAVVDADETRTAKALDFLAKNAEKHKLVGFNPSQVKAYYDYRKMFDELGKTIDAIFVATPNHHHALPAMIAMQLGKGAYVEKPLAHTIAEIRALAEASKKYKVATQMGNQGHCGEGNRRLCEYIWAGAIGKIAEVHTWTNRSNGGVGPRPPSEPVPPGLHWDEWIGPAPYREFHLDVKPNEVLHPHGWHGWYDFGNGSLGNLACHVMDGPVWSLHLKWPTTIEGEVILGGTDERYPTGDRLRYDFPARGDMPPVKLYWWDGKKKGANGAAGEEATGAVAPDAGLGKAEKSVSKASQFLPKIVVDLEKKYGTAKTPCNLGGDGAVYVGEKGIIAAGPYGDGIRFFPPELKDSIPAPAKTIPRVKDSFTDFIDACKAGTPTACSNFETAAVLAEIALLGNLAQKAGVGKKVEWDGPNMKCPNIPEVNKIVTIASRKGWTA